MGQTPFGFEATTEVCMTVDTKRHRGRILLLADVFPPKTGGSGRWLWETYRRVADHDIVVAAGTHPHQDEFDRVHDLRVYRLPLSFPTWGFFSVTGFSHYSKAFKSIREIVQREDVHIIHCATLLPEGWIAWLLQQRHGVPYLCYVHGEELNVGRRSRELGWLMRRVLSGARIVIANSNNTIRLLRDTWGLPNRRIRLLHPGTDVHRFTPAPYERDVRSRLGWDGRSVILTVGRLQRRKGHDCLIRALVEIRQHVPNVLYAIVGDGPERDRLEQLVDELGMGGHVQFQSDASDEAIIACYQQCDLFALPNREVEGDIEGFGIVLVEAQACGKPVIAGNSGGTAETMSCGITGELVRAESVQELASAIVSLLTDEPRRTRMGNAGREWAVQRFDWECLAVQAEGIFREFDARKVEVSTC